MNRPPDVPPSHYIAEPAPPRKEQRRHQRYAAEQPVTVYWHGRFGTPQESPAILRNVSAGGFGVELAEKIEVGWLVVVKAPDRSLQCMVRHVNEHSDHFLVGLEVVCTSDGSSCAQSLHELALALAKPDVE